MGRIIVLPLIYAFCLLWFALSCYKLFDAFQFSVIAKSFFLVFLSFLSPILVAFEYPAVWLYIALIAVVVLVFYRFVPRCCKSGVAFVGFIVWMVYGFLLMMKFSGGA